MVVGIRRAFTGTIVLALSATLFATMFATQCAAQATSTPTGPTGKTRNTKTAAHASSHFTAGGAPDKALMQKIWDAWDTLDPANAAPFYSKDPHNVFFDLAPMKYTGWAEYEQGVKALLAGFRSVKATIADDAQVWTQGDGALGYTTIHAEIGNKDGTDTTMEMRWTVAWHREGGKWLIVHEHVSVPLGGGPMGPGARPPVAKPQ